MMATMTSTAVRATSSLTVPSTQNTAPVLDFRCLYSFDLRRKAKRWQDGVLRFHTFNKRVMVYDVPRNFIGDSHWREQEPVQDGDEFELEKGVLIQVGEATGKMDQDLTGLFEKRGKAQAESPGKVVLPKTCFASTAVSKQASSATTASTQLRPRTLNSLLGTPKGPLGRAALPTKSPCEQRREDENRYIEDRASKRRRLEAPLDERHNGNPRISIRDTAIANSSVKHKASEGKTHNGQELPKGQATSATLEKGGKQVTKSNTRTAIFLDSEDEPKGVRKPGIPESGASAKKQQKTVRLEKPRKGKGRLSAAPESDRTLGADDPVGKRPSAEDMSISSIRPPASLQTQSHATATPNASTTSIEENPERSAQVRLRIASKKPRKKLMYRDLLPQASSEHGTVRKKSNATKSTCEEQPKDALSNFHQVQQDRLTARLRRQDEIETRRSNHTPEEGEVQRPESPSLFLTQEDDCWLPPASPDAYYETRPRTSEPQSPEHTNHQTSKRLPFLKHNRPPDPPITSTNAAVQLSEMDQLLLRRPRSEAVCKPYTFSHTSLPNPPKPSPPTSVSNLTEDVVAEPLLAPIPPSPIHILRTPYLPTLQRSLSDPASIQRKRSPLKKTVSDPTELRTLESPPSLQVKEAEPDPWSREAWDLFGFGRPGDRAA